MGGKTQLINKHMSQSFRNNMQNVSIKVDKKTASDMLGGTSRNQDTEMSEIGNNSVMQRKITDLSQEFYGGIAGIGGLTQEK